MSCDFRGCGYGVNACDGDVHTFVALIAWAGVAVIAAGIWITEAELNGAAEKNTRKHDCRSTYGNLEYML